MFLVRDWHNPAYRGLQGGCHILKDVLRIRNSHHDLTAVRENIHESFEDVGCMLLPKPGDRVEIRNENGPLVTIGGKHHGTTYTYVKKTKLLINEAYSVRC